MIPLPMKRTLAKFGQDVATARRKRRFTIAMMAERTGISLNTYGQSLGCVFVSHERTSARSCSVKSISSRASSALA